MHFSTLDGSKWIDRPILREFRINPVVREYTVRMRSREYHPGDHVTYFDLTTKREFKATLEDIQGLATIVVGGSAHRTLLGRVQIYPFDPNTRPQKLVLGDLVTIRGIPSAPGRLMRIDPLATFRVRTERGPSNPIPWRALK
jgi:hypothetical protein